MKSIDLGLSVKWADCNIGATKPEEYGDYFAWGETTPKDCYNWGTYRYGYNWQEMAKYCTDSDYGKFGKDGFVDNKTVLELADDAARANLGGAWRMPTDEEWRDLREKCTWIWTTRNGVNGYEVKSKINGNYIFIPASGFRDSNGLYSTGHYASYCSSSLDTSYPSTALGITIYEHDVRRNHHFRYYGLPIRPVLSND